MKKIFYLLTIVIMALLSLFIFVAEVVAAQPAQPISNNQEILLCIKYPLNEMTLSPQLVVFKSQLDMLLESTQELIQDESSADESPANEEEKKDDTLF